ncbi:alkaline phosphatase [Treponema sp. R8-4-B8]
MSNITFQKIQSKLNIEFAEEGRRIVFWYDEKNEWADQISKLELQNVEILFADGSNQFEIKYKIEYENLGTNYLIYSPLPKPDPNKDHLLDVFLYSREFKADSLALFAEELLIDKNFMPLLEKYGFFFRNTANQSSFQALGIDSYDDNSITLGMLCCLCDVTEPSIQNLIVHIITNNDISDNKYLRIFSENNLTDVFWEYCRNNLGWQEPSPTLEKLLITVYLTYFKRDLYEDLPEKYKPFIAQKTGNVTQILENLKNNKQKYQEYADYTAGKIKINDILQALSVESIVNCSVFKEVDKYITDWVIKRLINNDLGTLPNNKSLDIICDERLQKNAGTPLEHDYQMLKNAALLLSAKKTDDYSGTLEAFVVDYTKYYYKIDLYYRHFIENYDKLEDNTKYEELQNNIENYYTNSFLAKYISAWNKTYITGVKNTDTCRMRRFYSTFVKPLNKKTVVVISDALRYEVAAELLEIFKNDQNCTVNMKYMLGELPSVTSLGMAALLPNDKLDIALDGKVLCDGKQTDDLAKRRIILQSVNKNSECIQYNDFFQMKRDDMRSLLKNTDTLYVYHNQIDSRGENLPTEKDVFSACRDTINELYEKIKYLGKNANVYHFVVVSDHGFIYKREKLTESDKIGDVSKIGQLTNRRFIISGRQNQTDGICEIKIGDLLRNDNNNYILFPESVNVFKCSGGQNYVHGGSSPQELIIPVIDIDIEKYAVETRAAEIRLSRAIKPRINNLITTLEFLQTEAVSSEVKPETYEIFVVETDNANNKTQLLSDIQTITANKTGVESSDRLFKLTFNLKNQEYPKDKTYYLIIRRKDSTIEISRTEVIIDIAFAGNFGFF